MKKDNYLKRLLLIILFISIITQINICVTGCIKEHLQNKKEQKEVLQCPPDCCTLVADEKLYEVPDLPNIEVLDVNVKPIK